MDKYEIIIELFDEMDKLAIHFLKEYERMLKEERFQLLDVVEKSVDHLKRTGDLILNPVYNAKNDNTKEGIASKGVTAFQQNHLEKFDKLLRYSITDKISPREVLSVKLERISEEIFNNTDPLVDEVEHATEATPKIPLIVPLIEQIVKKENILNEEVNETQLLELDIVFENRDRDLRIRNSVYLNNSPVGSKNNTNVEDTSMVVKKEQNDKEICLMETNEICFSQASGNFEKLEIVQDLEETKRTALLTQERTKSISTLSLSENVTNLLENAKLDDNADYSNQRQETNVNTTHVSTVVRLEEIIIQNTLNETLVINASFEDQKSNGIQENSNSTNEAPVVNQEPPIVETSFEHQKSNSIQQNSKSINEAPAVNQERHTVETSFEDQKSNSIQQNSKSINEAPVVSQEPTTVETSFEVQKSNSIQQNSKSINEAPVVSQEPTTVETSFEDQKSNSIQQNSKSINEAPAVNQERHTVETSFEDQKSNSIQQNSKSINEAPVVSQEPTTVETSFEVQKSNSIQQNSKSINEAPVVSQEPTTVETSFEDQKSNSIQQNSKSINEAHQKPTTIETKDLRSKLESDKKKIGGKLVNNTKFSPMVTRNKARNEQKNNPTEESILKLKKTLPFQPAKNAKKVSPVKPKKTQTQERILKLKKILPFQSAKYPKKISPVKPKKAQTQESICKLKKTLPFQSAKYPKKISPVKPKKAQTQESICKLKKTLPFQSAKYPKKISPVKPKKVQTVSKNETRADPTLSKTKYKLIIRPVKRNKGSDRMDIRHKNGINSIEESKHLHLNQKVTKKEENSPIQQKVSSEVMSLKSVDSNNRPSYLTCVPSSTPVTERNDLNGDSLANIPVSIPLWHEDETLANVENYVQYIGKKEKNSFFGVGPKTVNLQEIFPTIDLATLKRTSSAIWNKSDVSASKSEYQKVK